MRSRTDALAYGVLLDALLNFTAAAREQEFVGEEAVTAWRRALRDMDNDIDYARFMHPHSLLGEAFLSLHGAEISTHIETEIEQRRTMLRLSGMLAETENAENRRPVPAVRDQAIPDRA